MGRPLKNHAKADRQAQSRQLTARDALRLTVRTANVMDCPAPDGPSSIHPFKSNVVKSSACTLCSGRCHGLYPAQALQPTQALQPALAGQPRIRHGAHGYEVARSASIWHGRSRYKVARSAGNEPWSAQVRSRLTTAPHICHCQPRLCLACVMSCTYLGDAYRGRPVHRMRQCRGCGRGKAAVAGP